MKVASACSCKISEPDAFIVTLISLARCQFKILFTLQRQTRQYETIVGANIGRSLLKVYLFFVIVIITILTSLRSSLSIGYSAFRNPQSSSKRHFTPVYTLASQLLAFKEMLKLRTFHQGSLCHCVSIAANMTCPRIMIGTLPYRYRTHTDTGKTKLG